MQLACSDLFGLRPLVRDIRQQARLWKKATSGPGHLSQAAEADLAAPAWTSPGVYSGAFGLFNEANAPYVASSPGQALTTAVADVMNAGKALQSDVQAGGLATGQPVQADYAAFRTAVAVLAANCGLKVPHAWLYG